MSRKSNSFTLVEIIAVLLVIAILAAVAAPKFVSIAEEARIGVAQAGMNEAKASLSVAFHKAYLQQFQEDGTTTVTAGDVLSASLLGSPATFGDIIVTLEADETTTPPQIDIVATTVGTHVFTVATPDVRPSDIWKLPTP